MTGTSVCSLEKMLKIAANEAVRKLCQKSLLAVPLSSLAATLDSY